MKCPVCKNECALDDKECSVCGFTELNLEFLNAEDALLWKNTVLEPYRLYWQSTIRKIESREVSNNEVFKEILVKNIGAFMFAEGGAMGSPGEFKFYVVKKDAVTIYFGNRYDERINQEFLNEKFRELKSYLEWEHIHLGFGNHLCIHPSILSRFNGKMEDIKEQNQRYPNQKRRILYQVYNEILIEIFKSNKHV